MPEARAWFKGRRIANPAIFFGLVLLTMLSGWLFLNYEDRVATKQAGKEMEAITSLRAEELSAWREQRIADGMIFSRNADFAEAFKKLLSDPSDAESRNKLLIWMSRFHEQYRYDRLLLFSPDGKLKLCIPEGYVDDPVLSNLAVATTGLDTVQLHDFYRNPSDSRVYLSVLVPILEEAQPGLLAMRINPEMVLYPSLKRWPYMSSSSETLLVRAEGNDVVFLNPLRFDPEAALNLRFSVSGNPELPAARAVSGRSLQFEGFDYHNVRVISAFSTVAGSPWFIVSKIDLSEVRAAGRTYVIIVLILVFALLGAETIGFMMLSKHWQARMLALEAEESRQRLDAETRNSQALLEVNANLELKVEQRTAELRTSNNELEAFAYSVAHDLKAPLRSIDGFSAILQEEFEAALGDEGKRLLGVIRECNHQMDELITNLLEVSRVSRVDLKPVVVDMRQLVKKAFSQCAEPATIADFELVLGDIPEAMADEPLMERVWANLLSNAVKYSAPSHIHRIEVQGMLQDGMNVYSVNDHGVGFDQHYAGKLFGMFQRLHSVDEFKGTGIGLTIVKRIVTRHGGTTWAEGRPGQGATFYFSIPGRA